MKPALLFYCQHSVGLGHLMRSYALCEGLAKRFRVTLLAGGDLPDGIDPPRNVELIALPPLGVQKNGFGTRSSHSVERTWELRHRRILMTLGRVQPKVVLVELFPFGRAKFAREIVPLLEEARQEGAFTACSLRDILVTGDQRKDDEARERADALLDAVLVHCDPSFARLEETFKPSTPLKIPVHYTGFVAGRNGSNGHHRGEHIVVSAGGGRVGLALLREAMLNANGRPMRAIAGPLMPDEDYAQLQELQSDNVQLLRSVPNLAAELSRAAGSISQCGYNTALDLVRTRVPALVIPYATAEEDEQTRRAHRLEALGIVKVAEHADPRLLDFTPKRARLDLDGAAKTAELLLSPGVKVLKPYVLRQWRALAGASAGTAVLALAELAKPWPIALIVDHLIADGDIDLRLLLAIGGLILLIAAAESGAQYFTDLWLQSSGEKIAHQLRVAIYDHLQRLSLAYHQRTPKGDLLTRVTEDVNDMGELFSDTLGEMLQSALLALGMTIVLLWIDPLLALLSLTTAPLLVVVSFIFRRKVRDRARKQRHHEGDLASIANEALSAMTVVKAFGAGDMEAERVRSRSEQRMGIGVEVARLQARFDGTVGVLRAFATAVVTVVGALRVASGDLSAGDLIIFVSYTRKASSPMRSFAREAAKLTAALARADRIAEVLTEDDLLADGTYRGPRARGEIELRDVSFAYGDRHAVHDISLRLAPGQRLALTGPSGAGKSTLASLVARFYDPTQGVVAIDGRDVRDCTQAWLREQIAVVLQDTVLFTGSVGENIAYGSDATEEEIVRAAQAAAAHDFIRKLPDGYDTKLGPQGTGLSGGQRQRIGIARTLLRNPPVIILDEPTTALDQDAENQVMEGLDRLMRGRTCILITHSARLASTADQIVELDHGRITEATLG